jgi:hypothetical protein
MTEPSTDLLARMKGAALLRVETYEEVEHDQNATAQAAMVVAIVAACQAIGASGGGLLFAGWAALIELGSWVVWAGLTYLIGEKIFGGVATWGELLRTLGFAKAPGVLFVLGVLPLGRTSVLLVVSVWMLVAAFIAIRQALDISNFKTLLTVLVGGGVYAVLQSFPLFPF